MLQVTLIAMLSLGMFWFPFLSKSNTLWGINFRQEGMNVIVQNFDGLNFLVIAKSLYNPSAIEQINSEFLTGNDPIYFAAHFPIFPLVVKLLSNVMSLPNALLATIIIANGLLAIGIYYFVSIIYRHSKISVLLTTLLLFFPARMLAVRSVGSNEPLFIFFVLVSIALAIKSKHWLSAVAGSLAVLTRSPGILLFAVYAWQWFMEDGGWTVKTKKYLPYLIMPIALISLFVFYGVQYRDPLAYFHSGDNLHLFFPPFQIFSNTASWISDMWREDIIYLYLFYGIGIAMIDARWAIVKKWGIVYGLTLLFVAHRDLARYALPIAPVAMVGFAPVLEKIPTKYWIGAAILIIPIYLFGWQFVLNNIQPIANWNIFT